MSQDLQFRQSSFAQGELGPFIANKPDLQSYKFSLQVAENVDIDTVGNMMRRNGFKSVIAIAGKGAENTTHYNNRPSAYRIIPFFVSPTYGGLLQRFALFLGPNIFIYDNAWQLMATITNSPYNNSYVKALDYCQIETCMGGSVKGLLLTVYGVKPHMILWTNAGTDQEGYEMIEAPIINYPSWFFDRKLGDPRVISGTTLRTGNVKIELNDNYAKVTAANAEAFAGDDNDPNKLNVNLKDQIIILSTGGKLRVVRRTDDGGFMCAIIESVGLTEVKEDEFTFEIGWEAICSETRKWPGLCAVYNGRLFLSGFLMSPNVIITSTADNMFDFSLGFGETSDGCIAQISSPYPITSLYNQNGLFAFTERTVNVINNRQQVIDPKTMAFTEIGKEVGNSHYLAPAASQAGGLYFYSPVSNGIKYVAYNGTLRSFVVEDIMPITMPDTFTIEESFRNNLCRIPDKFFKRTEQLFFINSRHQIVRCLVAADEENSEAGMTRYVFSDQHRPVSLFSASGSLYAVFEIKDSLGQFVSLLITRQSTDTLMDCAVVVQVDETGVGQVDAPYLSGITDLYLEDPTTGQVEKITLTDSIRFKSEVFKNTALSLGIGTHMKAITMGISDPNSNCSNPKVVNDISMRLVRTAQVYVSALNISSLSVEEVFYAFPKDSKNLHWGNVRIEINRNMVDPCICFSQDCPRPFMLAEYFVEFSELF